MGYNDEDYVKNEYDDLDSDYKQFFFLCIDDKYDVMQPRKHSEKKISREGLIQISKQKRSKRVTSVTLHLLDPNTKEVFVLGICHLYYYEDCEELKVYLSSKRDMFEGNMVISKTFIDASLTAI